MVVLSSLHTDPPPLRAHPHRAQIADLKCERRKRPRTPTVINHTTNYQQVNHTTNVFTTVSDWVGKFFGKAAAGGQPPALPAPTHPALPAPTHHEMVTRTTETRVNTPSQDIIQID